MTIPIAHKNEKQKEHSFTVGEKTKWYSHHVRQFGSFLKSKISYNPATFLSDIYPNDLNFLSIQKPVCEYLWQICHNFQQLEAISFKK